MHWWKLENYIAPIFFSKMENTCLDNLAEPPKIPSLLAVLYFNLYKQKAKSQNYEANSNYVSEFVYFQGP